MPSYSRTSFRARVFSGLPRHRLIHLSSSRSTPPAESFEHTLYRIPQKNQVSWQHQAIIVTTRTVRCSSLERLSIHLRQQYVCRQGARRVILFLNFPNLNMESEFRVITLPVRLWDRQIVSPICHYLLLRPICSVEVIALLGHSKNRRTPAKCCPRRICAKTTELGCEEENRICQ